MPGRCMSVTPADTISARRSGSLNFPEPGFAKLFRGMLLSLGKPANDAGPFDLGFYAVMHQFCRVMGLRQNRGRPEGHIAEQHGMTTMTVPLGRLH